MQNLTITTLQTSLVWENPEANRAHFDQLINGITSTDIIVLPEMFSTGFSMNPAPLAEEMNGPTVAWMRETAKVKHAALCGSVIIKENNNYFNRFIVAFSNGEIATYDKRHLFSMAGETEKYAAGSKRLLIEINGVKIMPLICYDLRFPVWARRTQKNNYDVLLFVANWPKPRIAAWSSLLVGRAIENQCIVVGVNRVGIDGNGHEYVGETAIVDGKGENVYKAPFNTEEVKHTSINLTELHEFRTKFPVIDDADDFTLEDLNY